MSADGAAEGPATASSAPALPDLPPERVAAIAAIVDGAISDRPWWGGVPDDARERRAELARLQGRERAQAVLCALAVWATAPDADVDRSWPPPKKDGGRDHLTAEVRGYIREHFSGLGAGEELEMRRDWRAEEAVALAEEQRGDAAWDLAAVVLAVEQAGRRPHLETFDEGVRFLTDMVRAVARQPPAPPELRPAVLQLRDRVAAAPYPSAEQRSMVARLTVLATEPGDGDVLVATDPWLARINAVAGELGRAGRAATEVAATARGARPSKAFARDRDAAVAEHGDELARAAGRILEAAAEAVPISRVAEPPAAEAGDVLRGLCWVAATADVPESARGLGTMAVAGWRKVKGAGPLTRKAGSTALKVLGELPEHGPAQLGRVRPQLRQAAAQKDADAAIDVVALRLGLERSAFEELVVPTFDLDDRGERRQVVGDHEAIVAVPAGGKPTLTFAAVGGKVLKSVPSAVRQDHPEALAALRQTTKDVTTMLAAQRLRLERLLLDDRAWTGDAWRARYVGHGLVGVLARRLIWTVDPPAGESRDVIVPEGAPIDVSGVPVEVPDDATVRLWHPAHAPAETVRAWRVFLEERRIPQPFKQAHREVYLLTGAERTTGTYTNRFAGHVLRQHQLAALARGRGWRYALQGVYDAPDEQAELRLPQHRLAARFWVQRPWDDGGGAEYSDAGIFTHVVTDQVTFAPLDPDAPEPRGDPYDREQQADLAGEDRLPLAEIPVRVLSEILRDVDLFVGVTSIGNDPEWQDRGDRRDRLDRLDTYWRDASFGELSATAETRKDVLGRLLPKLRLGEVARIDGRFLRVTGRRREYKIHLGSGNILMEPNDEYLCIVPASRTGRAADVFLPFEGDTTLDLILSKAMLLAADDEITDGVILAQLG